MPPWSGGGFSTTQGLAEMRLQPIRKIMRGHDVVRPGRPEKPTTKLDRTVSEISRPQTRCRASGPQTRTQHQCNEANGPACCSLPWFATFPLDQLILAQPKGNQNQRSVTVMVSPRPHRPSAAASRSGQAWPCTPPRDRHLVPVGRAGVNETARQWRWRSLWPSSWARRDTAPGRSPRRGT